MIKPKKTPLLIAILLISIWFILLIRSANNNVSCREALDFYYNEINSRVTEKYVDHENHGFLKLQLSNEEFEMTFVEGNQEAIIFERSSVGDSIIKSSNTSMLEIRNGEDIKYKGNVYFYRCDSTQLEDEKLK